MKFRNMQKDEFSHVCRCIKRKNLKGQLFSIYILITFRDLKKINLKKINNPAYFPFFFFETDLFIKIIKYQIFTSIEILIIFLMIDISFLFYFNKKRCLKNIVHVCYIILTISVKIA